MTAPEATTWRDLLEFRTNHTIRTVRPYATIRTMSTEVRLGPVSYLVLGIIAMLGPSTPYDLKRFVQRSVANFWPFPHTQLYAEPKRLAEAGLLEETREESGRRRRHYAITETGRQRLGRVALRTRRHLHRVP